MRYRFLLGWLLGMLLTLTGQAQCPVNSTPAGCQNAILAFANGSTPVVELEAFCEGQSVRFELCNAPSIFIITYQVASGTVPDLTGCNPSNAASYVYPTTAADAAVGFVTVFALANDGLGNSLFYRRVFPVFPKPAPAFQVVPCTGNNVRITFDNTSNYDQYYVQLGSGTLQGPYTRSQQVTLPTLGATSVQVIGRYAQNQLCENTATQPLPAPLAVALPPRFTRLTQAPRTGGTATLTFNDVQPGYLYTIEQDGQTIATLPATSSGTVSFPLPGAATGCYLLHRDDVCGLLPNSSAAICALSLTATAAPGQNNLSFAYSSAASSYTIYRDGNLLTTTSAPAYADSNVLCGSSYTYSVTAVLANGEESLSNEQTVTAISSNVPPPVPTLVASFTLSNTIELTPTLAVALPAGSTLRYQKAVGGLAPALFATTSTLRVVGDSTALDSLRKAPPCYTAAFVDVCRRVSLESAATCPALLSAAAADNEGNSVNLSWSNFTGPAPAAAITYTLQRLAPDGTVLSTQPVGSPSYTDLQPPADRQVLRYRLQISGGGIPAGSFSYSNVATVARRLRILIPTAFTPNGDGLNDVLEVKGRFLQNYSFVVVDRNGQEVFRGSQRTDTWDGRIKGHAPVNASYVWRFQQTDETGQLIRETGTITILQ